MIGSSVARTWIGALRAGVSARDKTRVFAGSGFTAHFWPLALTFHSLFSLACFRVLFERLLGCLRWIFGLWFAEAASLLMEPLLEGWSVRGLRRRIWSLREGQRDGAVRDGIQKVEVAVEESLRLLLWGELRKFVRLSFPSRPSAVASG